MDKLWQSFWKLKFMKNQALELHSPLPKSFKVCKEREAKRKSKQSEEENRGQQLQSSFTLLEHFPKSIFYIIYTISKLRKSRIQRFKLCTTWSLNEEDMAFGRQLLQACAKFAQHLQLVRNFAQHLLLVRNSHQPMHGAKSPLFFRLHFRYFPFYFVM